MPEKIQVYCLKEGKYTDTVDAKIERNAKGRPRIVGKCASCGAKKSRIVSEAQAKAFQEGGFLPALIPIAASVAAPVISHFVGKLLNKDKPKEGAGKKKA